jgi:outer membrane immunogenic protein
MLPDYHSKNSNRLLQCIRLSKLKGAVMHKLHIVGTVLIGAMSLGGSALAADMAPAPRAYYRAPVIECSWCGFYVGANVGADWSRSESRFYPTGAWNQDPNAGVLFVGGAPTFNRSSFSGGGQVGMNSQFFGFVVGLEVDLEYLGLKASRNAVYTGPFAGPFGGTAETFGFNENESDKWVSTQRVRFGWAASPVTLIYGTVGLAVSRQNYSQTYVIPNFNGGLLAPGFLVGAVGTGSEARWVSGWTAGGGAEFKLAPNWTVRAEYLYIDLGKVQVDSTLAGLTGPAGALTSGIAGYTAHQEDRLWTNVVRVGINYQFGAPAAVVPVRYK